MTAAVAVGLLVLALLDGAFAGFRSAQGRSGLIDHRRDDRVAAARGVVVVLSLLLPVLIVAAVDAVTRRTSLPAYTDAGLGMLAVYGPYAVIVLLALLAYGVSSWRKRYLAAAVILGPLTLLRPVVAVGGAVLAIVVSGDAAVSALACAAVVAVLAVEPVCDRLWYAGVRRRPASSRPDRTPGPAGPRSGLRRRRGRARRTA